MSSTSLRLFLFFFYSSADHRDLHSFPTRRSSDLMVSSMGMHSGRCMELIRDARQIDPAHRPLIIADELGRFDVQDRKSTRLNSSHMSISYAVFCLKKKKII